MKYMVQLDSLRAFAVLAVIFQHTWSGVFELGARGVHLFFVLSGFLITGILLKYRIDIENGESLYDTFRKFYIRRTLRIFPIYYLTIIAIAIIGAWHGRELFFWNITYLSNIKSAIEGNFENTIAHLWSLCVEEQFYLIWPIIILLSNKKYLKKIIIVTAISAPLFRLLLYWFVPNNLTAQYVLPFACVDFLALGALLAYERRENGGERYARTCLIAGIILFPLFFVMSDFFAARAPMALYGSIEALLCVGIIHFTAKGFGGFAKKIFEHNWLIYLGKVSYGIYLFHAFVAVIVVKSSALVGIHLVNGPTTVRYNYLMNTACCDLFCSVFCSVKM